MGHAWAQEAPADGAVPESMGAGDETCWERLVLVCLDLPTGSRLLAEAVAERRSATWKALVAQRRAARGAPGRSLVSDRAPALSQRADQGLGGLRIPEVVQRVHDRVQRYARAMGRQLRQARQAGQKAPDGLHRPQEREQGAAASPEATRQREAPPAHVRRWAAVQGEDRPRLAPRSLTLHPWRIAAAAPQTSTPGERGVDAQVAALEARAHPSQWPERQVAMPQVKKQVPALAARVDCWWAGVRQAGAHAAVSSLWRTWAHELLLPQVSGAPQVTRTRCPRRKTTMQQALEGVRTAFAHHAISPCLPSQALEHWHAWATHQVRALQRASSAVEGRNGSLAPRHHQQRGWPTQREQVWAVLHHFAGRAAEGTTPAVRFLRRSFPDLFETVLSHIGAWPRPRQHKRVAVLSG
jgi:hypothetical protein